MTWTDRTLAVCDQAERVSQREGVCILLIEYMSVTHEADSG